MATQSYLPGKNIAFQVGPEARFFIIHLSLLIVSPLFATASGIPHSKTTPTITLPPTDPTAFQVVCTWLYIRKPPVATSASDLLPLMKIWVALSKLGIWDKQNTIMRLGMALMQPAEFVCEISTVKWVYENTEPGCKLRGYIVAIYCQRGEDVSKENFGPEITKLGIFTDLVAFMRVLASVRRANPRGKDGYNIHEHFTTTYTRNGDAGGEVCWLLTHGEEVDPSRIEYGLPSFLVWGDEWQDLPDEHYFVGMGSVMEQGGREVLEQVGGGQRDGWV
jgi:hypothetical protein